jgi:hypothetical protein
MRLAPEPGVTDGNSSAFFNKELCVRYKTGMEKQQSKLKKLLLEHNKKLLL